MGTPDFAAVHLKALAAAGYPIVGVVTQPDRPRGRGGRVSFSPVKQAALELGLPVLQPARVKNPQAVADIAALQPDLAVVVAFGQILTQQLLDVPRLGCINVHASLLPQYRGAAPIHWAVINGETLTGVTTMWMDAGLDTGDMILRSEVPIGPEMTTGELHDRLAEAGAELLVRTLRAVERGDAPRTPQDHAIATYAPRLTPADERIDWTRPAAQIANLVRGMNPWPVAHTVTPRGRLKVWQARPWNPAQGGALPLTGAAASPGAGSAAAAPGTVVAVRKGEGLLVQTGGGLLLLQEVQPENGRRMTAEEYARGQRLEPGAALAHTSEQLSAEGLSGGRGETGAAQS